MTKDRTPAVIVGIELLIKFGWDVWVDFTMVIVKTERKNQGDFND